MSEVRRGVMVRQGVQDEVVNRVNSSVLLAEIRRRASWKLGGVRKGVNTRLFWQREDEVLNGWVISTLVLD